MSGYDPRRVANLLLDLADKRGIPLTHVKLQKLVYFADESYFVRSGKSLISGNFEAWQHGPVCPTLYQTFKPAGSDAISFRAMGRDLKTGESNPLSPINNLEVEDELVATLRAYGHLSAWKLVDLSHSEGGPWDSAIRRSKAGKAVGTIIERRASHYRPDMVKLRLVDEESAVAMEVEPLLHHKG